MGHACSSVITPLKLCLVLGVVLSWARLKDLGEATPALGVVEFIRTSVKGEELCRLKPLFF